MKSFVQRNYRFNLFVSSMDGGFFGFALGFASFLTILPLFVSTMTDSAILIGLIPAIHSVGWQLPQLFIAHRVSRLKRFKPMVLYMTIHERLPFLGLAIVAWLLPHISTATALFLTYLLLIWQGLGGGFTANPWQSMMAKIIPPENRGTFFGFQSASANLLYSISAVVAGLILEKLGTPHGFALCFLLTGFAMAISFSFLAQTREEESAQDEFVVQKSEFWRNMLSILQRDRNFRWFLVVRMLSQLAIVAFSFYTVYAARYLGMNDIVAGLMMGVFTIGQIAANPIMGWIGDRSNYLSVMKIGLLSASISAFLAWLAHSLTWFYLVYVLAGIANVATWTIGIAMTLEFGTHSDRPTYIGLANTLVAPSTFLAPILGGWLADRAGFPVTFILSAISGIVTVIILQIMLRDPRKALEETKVSYYMD